MTDNIGYDDLFENYDFSTAGISYKYTLTGGETYYILVSLSDGYLSNTSKDLTVVTHDLCSDLNHDDFCDADQSFLGESIIPGESFDVKMYYEYDTPTTSWAVFTPEEDGVYRFTTPYFDSNGGSLGNVAFSLYEGVKIDPIDETEESPKPIAESVYDGQHMLAHELKAGKTYILRMYGVNYHNEEYTHFDLKLDKLHTCADTDGDGICDECDSVIEVELTLDQITRVDYPEVNVYNPVYLKFTPSGSGTYCLQHNVSNGDLTQVSLYASDKTTLIPFTNVDSYNYYYECYLEAGQTYYFKTDFERYNSAGAQEYSLTCTHANQRTVPAVTVATCRTPAYTEHQVCTACGEKFGYVETAPQLEHSFTNYISNNDGTETATCENGCGETDTRSTFSATYTVSLNLARSIDLNFSIKNAKFGTETVSKADLASKLQVVVNSKTVALNDKDISNGEVELKSVVSKKAKEMYSKNNIEVYYDGKLVKEIKNYSMLDYCEAVITKYPNQPISDLCYALLNYSRWQSKEYSPLYNATTIENRFDLDAMQRVVDKYSFGAENAAPISPQEVVANKADITTIETMLSINTTTYMIFYITTPTQYTKDDFVVVNEYGQLVHPDCLEAEYYGSEVVLTIKNITANTLSRSYTITLKDVDESEFKIVFSPYNYLELLYNMDGSSKPVANAIYVYGQAATAFQPYDPTVG